MKFIALGLTLFCLILVNVNIVYALDDIIIDNDDPGTSSTGTWQVSGGENPYGTDSLWSRDGATYTWHADLPQTGVYEVYMWWTEFSSRSTNVPVTITHLGGSQVVYVNQTQNGGTWNYLSTYSFDAASGGNVTITAEGSVSSYSADAVKFVYVPGANIPPIATIESISPNPAQPGEKVNFAGNGTYSDGTVENYSWNSSLDGVLNYSASFNTSTLSEGTHTIFFKVQDNNGNWSEEVTETLIISEAPTEVIIDNDDPGTSSTGTWQVSGGENPYGTDSLWSRDGATYTWHADLPQTGVYEVYMWWTEFSSRSTNVPVTIEYDGGSQVVYVNQTQNGGAWNYLSTYSFDAASGGNVTITAEGSVSSYSADAVKFVYVPDPEAPNITSYAPETPVSNVEGASRPFNITVNQTVNVSWLINGTEVSNQTDVTESIYTNTSAAAGYWNVSAVVENTNGTAMHTWIWNVTSYEAPAPVITGYAPDVAVVNDTEGASRPFNITVNQTVNVSWLINGTEVSNQTDVTESIYTNTSAAAGYWNLSAVVDNANGTAMHTWIWNVTAYEAPAPVILGYAPDVAVVNDTEGGSRSFNITVNQTVNVSWLINGTEVSNQTGVTESIYTNTSAAAGYWNVSAVVENTNGTTMHTWMWNVTSYEAPAPVITGYAPDVAVVNDTEGASRPFNITVNQTVNVSWLINGTEVSNQSGVTESIYTNTSAAAGYWNVSAVVENVNGTAMHTWMWNVTSYDAPAPAPAPVITGYAPDVAVVNDTEGASRPFNITVNQTVNVSWLINGTDVSNQSGVTESIYTNTSAAAGYWNVSAVVENVNGTAMHTWIWNVTSYEAPTPAPVITDYAPDVAVVNDTEGASRPFNITVNQTVNVSWLINGTEVSNQTDVTESIYTNTSAAAGYWNLSAVVENTNGTAMHIWIWNVTSYEAPAEVIIDNGDSGTSYTGTWQVSGGENPYGTDSLWSRDGATYTWHADLPQTGVYEVYMWWTEFSSRSTNVPVTITHLGGSQVVYVNQTQNGGTWNYLSTYSFDAASGGNVTITAEGSVSSYSADAVKFVYVPDPEAPNITSYAPETPVSNVEGASRTFNITVNQTVNVSWLINGTEVSNQTDVTESIYTNTSAAAGYWNVSAVVDNVNGTAMHTWIWNVTSYEAPAPAPVITDYSPDVAVVNDTEGASRLFNITVNQTVTVTWLINGTDVYNQSGVIDSIYTNTSAAAGYWNVSVVVENTNGTAMHTWIWNVTSYEAPAPVITGYAPDIAVVNDTEGASRPFNITVNQTVNVSWLINGTEVSNQSGVTESIYTNTSAAAGYWNVSAVVENTNGTAMHTWIWNVTVYEAPAPAPVITGYAPDVAVVNDTEGASRPFNITVNQTVNVSWLINGTEVSNQTDVTESIYTNTSAAAGYWNLSAVVDNANGTAMHTWIWNVTSHEAPAEVIIDNGDPGTSYTGTWGVSGGLNPYGTDSLWSRDGATYTWHADLPQTGVYEVYVWWTEYSSRSTNAPVTIEYDGGSQVVYVNQTQNGGTWNYLSTYSFDAASGGNVTITTEDSVSSYSADAVKFVYVPGANIPPVATIESISPNPAQPGEKVTFAGNGTDSDGTIVNYSWRSSLDGPLNDSASFSNSTLTEGTHTIFLKVQDNDGFWSSEVSEKLIIGDIIIDNGDPGTSYTGIWGLSGGLYPYGPDSLHRYGRYVTNYTWHADLPETGVYEVYMWWTEYYTRSTNAPVTIEYDGGSHVVYVNQMQNGGMWNHLSTYSFNETIGGTVTITSAISPYSYSADAVKFVYVPGANIPSIATIESITPNPAQPGEKVIFAGNGTDSDGTVENYSWRSSLDGVLSNSASFNNSTLSEGTHTIFFKVQDNNGVWSLEVSEELIIGEPPSVIVCYGDSITNSMDNPDVGIYPDTLKESLSNYYNEPKEVINEGYGGWTSYDGSAYVNTIISKYPDMEQVCLMFGTNDASDGTPLSDYKTNMGYMIDAFQNEGINVILGILPPVSEVREFQHDRALMLNEVLRELALEKEVYVADTSFYFNDTWSSTYFQDELHPNSVGYEIIGNTSFFLPIVDSHRLHNGYNLLSTNTIVANDSVEEINVTATTWDKGRVNTTVTTYNSTQFTFIANGTTNITINMSDGLFDIDPSTEYYVYRDGFGYINISSTPDGYLLFTVPLGGIHTIDVFDTYYTPRPNITNWHNNKTNDQSLVLYINRSEEVIFNVTVDLSVITYNWVKDGIPDVGDDSFRTSWDTFGAKTVSVNATNANGVTDTITWNIIIINPQEIIIDNGDFGTSSTGTWQVSGGENPYGTDSLWSRDGATYTWYADLQQTGVYEVYMWWTEFSSRSTNAPVTITHLGGSQVVYVNQTQNGGMWNYLSTYSFDAASGGNVTITAEDSVSSYSADAVKFVYVPDPEAPNITSYAPETPVSNVEGASRPFNITVNQTVNVSWLINGTEVSNQSGVTESIYTNTSAAAGYWNVSAVVENVNGTAMHTWMWNVTSYDAPAPAPAPVITGYAPDVAVVNDTEGASRPFNITVNQTVTVTWLINGTDVYNQSGVIDSIYTNTSAAAGYWNVSTVVENVNGSTMHTWMWNVTAYEAPAPFITGYAPDVAVANDTEGASRPFNITVNQTVNVSWLINGTEVSNQTDVTESIYTNTSAAAGYWNVSAVVENVNGTAMHTWMWNVTAYEAPAPVITGYAPDVAVVNDTEGASRPFNITVNQTVNVSWLINGTDVYNQSGVIDSIYTNTSAAAGYWNLSAVVDNANGTAMHTWIWNVTAYEAP